MTQGLSTQADKFQCFLLDIEFGTMVSILALVVSVVAIWVAKRNWRESYRPIVSAYIKTDPSSKSVGPINYRLVVINSGSRPAFGVRLEVTESALTGALAAGAARLEELVSPIRRCFSSEYEIPVLVNGDTTQSSFGQTTGIEETSVLRYGSEIPIIIRYADTYGKEFKSSVTLVVRDTRSFTDGTW